jgi:predicted dehydrogenase
MAQVRLGLLGVGQRGLQHLNSLWQLADAQVVALCDPYAENLEEAKIQGYVDGFSLAGIQTYTAFDDMLAAGGLDAIYFNIPPGSHDGELLRAAAAGIHIFAEKPVSLFLDEALEMDAAVRAAGVISTVGFNQRHCNWHTAMRDFLADKRLVMMTVVANGALEGHSVKHTHTETEGGPGNRIWAANYAWSGSTVVEAGIHQLDLMRYWAGDVAWVEGRYIQRDTDDIVDGGDNPYGYSVTFGFENGMIGNMLLTRLRRTFYNDGYQGIIWDHGHLKLEGQGPVAYYYDGPYPPPGGVSNDQLCHPLEVAPRNDNTLEITRAFIQAVGTQDPAPLHNSFASSINSHAAVLGANISDQLGGQRVDLHELLNAEQYGQYRRKPGI